MLDTSTEHIKDVGIYFRIASILPQTGANSYQAEVRGPWIINGDFTNRFGVNL